eukprot:3936049-Rhodomonas_salina.1
MFKTDLLWETIRDGQTKHWCVTFLVVWATRLRLCVWRWKPNAWQLLHCFAHSCPSPDHMTGVAQHSESTTAREPMYKTRPIDACEGVTDGVEACRTLHCVIAVFHGTQHADLEETLACAKGDVTLVHVVDAGNLLQRNLHGELAYAGVVQQLPHIVGHVARNVVGVEECEEVLVRADVAVERLLELVRVGADKAHEIAARVRGGRVLVWRGCNGAVRARGPVEQGLGEVVEGCEGLQRVPQVVGLELVLVEFGPERVPDAVDRGTEGVKLLLLVERPQHVREAVAEGRDGLGGCDEYRVQQRVDCDAVLEVSELGTGRVQSEQHSVGTAHKDAHLRHVLREPGDVALRAFRASLERDALAQELHGGVVVASGRGERECVVDHVVQVGQVFEAGGQVHGQYEPLDGEVQRDGGPCGKEVAVDLDLCARHAVAEVLVEGLKHGVDFRVLGAVDVLQERRAL